MDRSFPADRTMMTLGAKRTYSAVWRISRVRGCTRSCGRLSGDIRRSGADPKIKQRIPPSDDDCSNKSSSKVRVRLSAATPILGLVRSSNSALSDLRAGDRVTHTSAQLRFADRIGIRALLSRCDTNDQTARTTGAAELYIRQGRQRRPQELCHHNPPRSGSSVFPRPDLQCR